MWNSDPVCADLVKPYNFTILLGYLPTLHNQIEGIGLINW